MPKISEAKRASRRAEITDAALRCFVRAGYQRTSMADIIAESGLSAGAIYSYFDGKQQLVKAVAEQILDARRAELAAASADHAVSPAGIIRMLAAGVRAQAPVQVLIQVWAEATVDDDLRALMQEVLGRMRGTVVASLARWAAEHPSADGLSPEDWAARTAPVLMSVMPGYILQSAIVDDFDDAAYLDAVGLLLP